MQIHLTRTGERHPDVSTKEQDNVQPEASDSGQNQQRPECSKERG